MATATIITANTSSSSSSHGRNGSRHYSLGQPAVTCVQPPAVCVGGEEKCRTDAYDFHIFARQALVSHGMLGTHKKPGKESVCVWGN